VLALGVAASALGQGTFSIDWQGPPIGIPDACAGGPPLTEGDILRTFTGTLMPCGSPPPCIVILAGPGGLGLPLWPAAVGHPPGVPGRIEVDALSYGRDQRLRRFPNLAPYRWHFSVDEFSGGIPVGPAPNLFTEGVFGGAEASADVFMDFGLPSGPICAPAPRPNVLVADGDGCAPLGGSGLGLFEPNPPTPGIPADPGTNLDALDLDTPPAAPIFPVYFSLDSGFLDPMEGFPNSASAIANGFGSGGHILMTPGPGAFPIVWAPAPILGLDLFGPDTDDLDGLVLWENGNGVYDPPTGVYSWLSGATDMVFFSIRRGSALELMGVPDSRCGLPIEPGDILMPGPPGGGPPGIWIPAEALGLQTRRSGFNFQDDLNALDVVCRLPGDINGDGIVDLSDLAIVLANFGCVPPPACPGDVDGDGDVDLSDLAIVLAAFGSSC